MICLCKAEEFLPISSRIFWKGSQFFFNLAHVRNWESHMNPCRALWSCYLSARKHVFALGPGRWRESGNLFWGFGVIASWFGGRRARGWSLSPGCLITGAVGKKLVCLVEIRSWGFRGPFRGFRFGFFCNGGGERAEEDLIGRTVFVERTAFKVSEGLNTGDLQAFYFPFEEVSEIW